MAGLVRVACITLDSADHTLVRQWVDQGLLPHLAKHLEQSVSSMTRDPKIIDSGTFWPSFNTSLWPGQHNQYCYLQPDDQGYGMQRLRSDHLSGGSIWNAIARKGYRVAFEGVSRRVA